MTLRLDFVSNARARYACENWHYAGVMPTGKLVKIGVWEEDEFVGVVVFSRGASPHLGKRYGLDATEICELTRIALREHEATVSKIISRAVRLLRQSNPGLRLAVSFADPAQGHHGGVYQASGWVYTGRSNDVFEYFVGGRWRHVRGSYHTAKGDPSTPVRTMPGKHRYVLPLDPKLRPLVELNARPYPKRAAA